jgi:hypothetical protein
MCQPVPGKESQFNEQMIGVFTDGLRNRAPAAQ